MKALLFLIIISAALYLIYKCAQQLDKKLEKNRRKGIVIRKVEGDEEKKIAGTAIQLYGVDSKMPILLKTPESEAEHDKTLIKFLLQLFAIAVVAIGLMIAISSSKKSVVLNEQRFYTYGRFFHYTLVSK